MYTKHCLFLLISLLIINHYKSILFKEYLLNQFINKIDRSKCTDYTHELDVLINNFDNVENKEIFITLNKKDIIREYRNLKVHKQNLVRIYSSKFLLGIFLPILLPIIKFT